MAEEYAENVEKNKYNKTRSVAQTEFIDQWTNFDCAKKDGGWNVQVFHWWIKDNTNNVKKLKKWNEVVLIRPA